MIHNFDIIQNTISLIENKTIVYWAQVHEVLAGPSIISEMLWKICCR